MDARTKAIIAHFTIIGWVVALILNGTNKDQVTSFYLRQTLGLYIVGLILSWIPILNIISWLVVFAFWLLSLVYVIQGQTKAIPFGEYFQEWFAGL
jgi:hypothetical protein